MHKNRLWLVLGVLSAIVVSGVVLFFIPSKTISPLSPASFTKGIEDKVQQLTDTVITPKSALAQKDQLNVLLVGSDRRTKNLEGNTDVLILASVNLKTNRILLTSVPRDLWVNENKINAIFASSGWEALKAAYEKITGLPIDGYIICDFSDFKWIVDAFGGVDVTIQRTFTDTTFPNDSDTGLQTVAFIQGPERLTGARALIFARSRHGDNGEGSDLMRARRQHLMLQGMVESIQHPGSSFWPMDIEKFYNAVSAVGRMRTSLTLDDAKFLWEFYEHRKDYQIESFVVADGYLHFPGLYPESPYKAWVFIPNDPTWGKLHTDIKAKLDGTFVDTEQTQK